MLYIPKRPKKDPISNNNQEESSQIFKKWTFNTISCCINKRTPLCILNHYHHYFYDWNVDSITRTNLLEQWQQILHRLNKIPFLWKTTFFGLHQRIRKLREISISKTGQKITIISNELIDNFSFKLDKKMNLEKEGEYFEYDEEYKTIVTIKQLRPDFKSVFYLK